MITPGVSVFEVDRDLKVLFQMDRKLSQAAGIDHNLLSQMLDPKALAGMDPKMLQTYGLDPKWFDPKNMGMDLKTFSKIDPRILGLDPNLLQSMEINLKELKWTPKHLHHLHNPQHQQQRKLDQRDPKFLTLAGIDSKMLARMDPKV